jgi:biopolymer transport protein ExbD
MASNRQRGVFKKMQVHIGPNMTPMVDVVMCILIFFMLGSTLATPELFLKSNTAAIDKAGLGDMAGTQKLPSVRMTIKLSRQAAVEGGQTLVSAFDSPPMRMSRVDEPDQSLNQAIFGRLADRRKTISDDVQVLIVPEANVPYQDVITIYDFCTKLKFKQVAFYPVK